MGMGEPLLNLPAVSAAYQLLHEGLGLSGRAITVSTVGVPNAIRKLAALKLPVTLAVSIHAPNQALRERLIPSAKVYPIEALMQVGGRMGYAWRVLSWQGRGFRGEGRRERVAGGRCSWVDAKDGRASESVGAGDRRANPMPVAGGGDKALFLVAARILNGFGIGAGLSQHSVS
jgi:hypothetical protein